MEVKIARCCHCVKKNDLPESTITDSPEEAQKRAEEILGLLEERSCKAHCFFIRENETSVIVDSRFNDGLITL